MTFNKTGLLFVCYLIGFIGSFLLLVVAPAYRGLEFALLLIGALLTIITLVGTAVNARWSYPLSTIIATLLIANSSLLYLSIGKYFLTFVLTLLALTLAVIISISSSGTKTDDESELTSEETEQQTTTQKPTEPAPKKRGRPKKKKDWDSRTDMKVFRE